MKPKFKKMVDNGDLEGVRISLGSEMMLDPRGDSFKEMLAYAEKAFPDLYESHNGEALDLDCDKWTEDHLFKTRNALDENFSKERLDYYFKVAKVVLKDKAETLDRETRLASRTTTNGTTKTSKPTVTTPSVCLTAGGVIIGGLGLILSKPIITTVGMVGAIVGVYKMYNDNRK